MQWKPFNFTEKSLDTICNWWVNALRTPMRDSSINQPAQDWGEYWSEAFEQMDVDSIGDDDFRNKMNQVKSILTQTRIPSDEQLEKFSSALRKILVAIDAQASRFLAERIVEIEWDGENIEIEFDWGWNDSGVSINRDGYFENAILLKIDKHPEDIILTCFKLAEIDETQVNLPVKSAMRVGTDVVQAHQGYSQGLTAIWGRKHDE